jgi:phosphoribosyl 1,2-cyclic phosphodiesterase
MRNLAWTVRRRHVPSSSPYALAMVMTAGGMMYYQQHSCGKMQCESSNYSPTPEATTTSTSESSTKTPLNRIVFLGTGSSTGCPRPLCAMLFPLTDDNDNDNTVPSFIRQQQEQMRDQCKVSALSMQGDPRHNPNYRGNPSLLIQFTPPSSSSSSTTTTTTTSNDDNDSVSHVKNVVIDAGKTFREHSLRWFPHYKVYTLDGVILTHEHADATFGLDELRGYQRFRHDNTYNPTQPGARAIPIPMPLYLSQPCLDDIRTRMPWFFPQAPVATTDPNDPMVPEVKRYTSSFDVHIMKHFEPITVADGLVVTPLPVMHGEDLVSLGFAVTVHTTHIVYLSDISRMLPETLAYLQEHMPLIDILIVDTLLYDRPSPVHFQWKDAWELIQQLQPKQSYLVGMNCDAFPPHDEMNDYLHENYSDRVHFAHDGLAIDC